MPSSKARRGAGRSRLGHFRRQAEVEKHSLHHGGLVDECNQAHALPTAGTPARRIRSRAASTRPTTVIAYRAASNWSPAGRGAGFRGSTSLASRTTLGNAAASIRGMRIRVSDVLEMLAAGVQEPEILSDFPDLEAEDIRACLRYAARRPDLARLVA